DRPPLLLRARVNFADGRGLPLTLVNVHQRSLNSAEEDSPSGVRVRAKRQEQAKFLANLVQGRQLADPAERIVVLGDFNAFEFNDGYGDSMGTVTGLPSPDEATVVPGDGADLVDPDLYDLTFLGTPDTSYSYAFDGNVQSLDHVLANAALMDAADVATLSVSHARINADFPAVARNAVDSPTRLSDHDPTLLLLRLQAAQSADLHVSAGVSPGSVLPGETATFTADVGNAGPDAAAFAAVAFVFDQAVDPTVTPAAGWACSPPDTTTTTTVTCTIDSLAAGATQSFSLAVTATAAQAGAARGGAGRRGAGPCHGGAVADPGPGGGQRQRAGGAGGARAAAGGPRAVDRRPGHAAAHRVQRAVRVHPGQQRQRGRGAAGAGDHGQHDDRDRVGGGAVGLALQQVRQRALGDLHLHRLV